jgi:hypothetical protein
MVNAAPAVQHSMGKKCKQPAQLPGVLGIAWLPQGMDGMLRLTLLSHQASGTVQVNFCPGPAHHHDNASEALQ